MQYTTDGIFCFVQLHFPKNNIADWEQANTTYDEYEWEGNFDYMISDLELSTIKDFIQSQKDLCASGKIFFQTEPSQDGNEIILKGYMDFDTISMQLIGWINLFRKAAEFGAVGKAAFMSDTGWLDPIIMYAFEIKPDGTFHSYICPEYTVDDPESHPQIKEFNTIWNDEIATDIKKLLQA